MLELGASFARSFRRFRRWRFGLQRQKVSFLATSDEAFGDGFQLFPASANVVRLLLRDLVVRGGGGDYGQQIGKFLHDLIGGGDQVGGVRFVDFWIENEEAARPLTDPLDEAPVVRAAQQRVNSVQRVGAAAAGTFGAICRLRTFVNQGEGKPELGGYLFGAAFLKHFAQEFM